MRSFLSRCRRSMFGAQSSMEDAVAIVSDVLPSFIYLSRGRWSGGGRSVKARGIGEGTMVGPRYARKRNTRPVSGFC